MSFRSFFLFFLLSLGWVGAVYPVLVKGMKLTKNGQTVFLLGYQPERWIDLAQEEKHQIDYVLQALNERAKERQRKVRILYQKAPTSARSIHAMANENTPRFMFHLDQFLAQLKNPDICLQDVEDRVASREIQFILRCNGDLRLQDPYYDAEKAVKELKDVTFNDFWDELRAYHHRLSTTIESMPSESAKEVCRKFLARAWVNIDILKREVSYYHFDEGKPVVESSAGISEDYQDELVSQIHYHTGGIFQASVAHRIILNDSNEDIVVIVDDRHARNILQYLFSLDWSCDAYTRDDDEREFLSDQELHSVLYHKNLSEKIMHMAKEFVGHSHQSLSRGCERVAGYLESCNKWFLEHDE